MLPLAWRCSFRDSPDRPVHLHALTYNPGSVQRDISRMKIFRVALRSPDLIQEPASLMVRVVVLSCGIFETLRPWSMFGGFPDHLPGRALARTMDFPGNATSPQVVIQVFTERR
jgi:hypothetical protein